ncbi:alpha/beta fold hydrolase [Lysobacter sp. CA196]|uniref:alpha/beta fold hydrolase n=1 Tax=Lysobacter sp. CA196 TaxID=3455606 RepID=UPI003F8D3FA1
MHLRRSRFAAGRIVATMQCAQSLHLLCDDCDEPTRSDDLAAVCDGVVDVAVAGDGEWLCGRTRTAFGHMYAGWTDVAPVARAAAGRGGGGVVRARRDFSVRSVGRLAHARCVVAGPSAGTGFRCLGLDFAGYGYSERPALFRADPGSAPPWGDYRMGAAQIAAAIAAIRRERPRVPIHLLAHSWGTLPARQVAIEHPDTVAKLVLFGPVSTREGSRNDEPAPAWTVIGAADQRPRQRSGLPADIATPVGAEELERWCRAYLASDDASATRSPPSVQVPNGPMADIDRLWAGQALVDNTRVRQPTLIVRGEWDHVTTDADAARLYAELSGAAERREVKISGGNHWLHLQPRRSALWSTTTAFLRD